MRTRKHTGFERCADIIFSAVFRISAIFLFVVAILVLYRGYLLVGGHREEGIRVYLYVALAFLFSAGLWVYGRRRT